MLVLVKYCFLFPLAKATTVEEDREVEISKAAPSLLPGERASASGEEEEEEDDSLSPSHDVVKAEEYKLDTVSRGNYDIFVDSVVVFMLFLL